MTLLSECYHAGFQSSEFIRAQVSFLKWSHLLKCKRKHCRFSTQNEPTAHDLSSTAVFSEALDCFKLAFATVQDSQQGWNICCSDDANKKKEKKKRGLIGSFPGKTNNMNSS